MAHELGDGLQQDEHIEVVFSTEEEKASEAVIVKTSDILTPQERKEHRAETRAAKLKELADLFKLGCFKRKAKRDAHNTMDVEWVVKWKLVKGKLRCKGPGAAPSSVWWEAYTRTPEEEQLLVEKWRVSHAELERRRHESAAIRGGGEVGSLKVRKDCREATRRYRERLRGAAARRDASTKRQRAPIARPASARSRGGCQKPVDLRGGGAVSGRKLTEELRASLLTAARRGRHSEFQELRCS